MDVKKVLYLSYDGMTDPLGQSQVLPYLRQLTAHGYRFTVLSFEKKSRFQKEGATIRALCQEAGISWVPLTFTARPPVLAKMYDRLRMRRTAIALHRQNKFALVHCRSYVAAEVGLLLKQRYGTRLLFDMRGFWADEKVDNGQWPQTNSFFRNLYRVYKKKEAAFLLQADGIISLTQAAKDHLVTQHPYRHLPITVIPCCADLEHFNYEGVSVAAVDHLKAQLHIPPHATVVTYLGSIGGWYMTKEMFSFFKLLQQQQPDSVLLVLTKDDQEKVRAEAAAAGVPEHDLRVTYAERKQVPLHLALSTASIFFIRNTFSKMASSPTKHAELMGMGIPVICNDIGDTGHIIRSTQTGMLVNDFSPDALQQAAAHFSSLQNISKEHIRSCARQYFDLQTGVVRYAQVYQSLLEKERQPHTV